MNEIERAYLAGIIDGEGSITLTRHTAGYMRGRYIYPLVRVANTDTSLFVWIKERVPYGHRGYTSKMNSRCKDVFHVTWAAREAIAVLREVLDYLVIKRSRAEIVLDLFERTDKLKIESKKGFGKGYRLTPEIVELREAAFAKVALLNRRGV